MSTPTIPPLVLASTSPYRRALLERLGLPFETAQPRTDETPRPGEAPEALALRLAEAKARAVATRFPGALILGSDQVASCAGEIFGKPGDLAKAAQQLQRLSGRTVIFHTAACLLDTRSGRCLLDDIPTQVTFRDLSAAEITAYLQREPAYDCAGSAKAEGLGIALLRRCESSDPTALIGLPLITVCDFLRQAGVALP